MRRVGLVLRRLRQERKLSQPELGKLAGVSAAYISQLESGRRPNPRFEIIATLAAALRVPLDTIAAECGLPHAGSAADVASASFLRIESDVRAIRQSLAHTEKAVNNLEETLKER